MVHLLYIIEFLLKNLDCPRFIDYHEFFLFADKTKRKVQDSPLSFRGIAKHL